MALFKQNRLNLITAINVWFAIVLTVKTYFLLRFLHFSAFIYNNRKKFDNRTKEIEKKQKMIYNCKRLI